MGSQEERDQAPPLAARWGPLGAGPVAAAPSPATPQFGGP